MLTLAILLLLKVAGMMNLFCSLLLFSAPSFFLIGSSWRMTYTLVMILTWPLWPLSQTEAKCNATRTESGLRQRGAHMLGAFWSQHGDVDQTWIRNDGIFKGNSKVWVRDQRTRVLNDGAREECGISWNPGLDKSVRKFLQSSEQRWNNLCYFCLDWKYKTRIQ